MTDAATSESAKASCCHAGKSVVSGVAGRIYTCPMHPEVRQDDPGSCPICHMTLVPVEYDAEGSTPKADQAHDAQSHHNDKVETKSISTAKTGKGVIYTCPMHPQIRQDGPGFCPICGMALEPETITLEEPENHELKDMSRRLWIATILSVPVAVLAMGAHVGLSKLMPETISLWTQMSLATPVAIGCGWPFIVRGWDSLKTRHFNMFTLIALAVCRI